MSDLLPLAEVLKDAEVFTDGDWVESKDQDPQGDVRLVQLADVGDGYWIDKSERFLTSRKASELRCTFLKPGDVLVARMPEPLGRCCIFPGDEMPCVTVVDVCVIRPNPSRVDARFLMHGINSPVGRTCISQYVTGTTRQRISRSNLSKIQIPLPPLTEQKRIAAILDAADALRAKRRESIEQLDSLVQATFLEMFGDPVTNPKGWAISRLGEVADFHAGSTLPPAHAFVGQRDGFLYLKVSDLNSVENQSVVVAAQLWHSSKQKGIGAPAKSVVIPKRGGAIGTNKKRLLGRSAVLDPNLMAISCKTDLHPSYLLRWFHTFDLVDITSGSTVPQLNKRDLAPLAIGIPPLDLQTRFASIVESIEHQKASLKTHLAELDALFSSLQSRAFNGELVA